MITVGIETVAGEHQGYGHIVRCLELARLLEERDCFVHFRGNEEATRLAIAAGHPLLPNGDVDMDVWIVDLPGGIPLGKARHLVPLSKVLVTLQGRGQAPDGNIGRYLCDLVFYQGVTREPHLLNWEGFFGMWYEGVDWLILRTGIEELRDRRYRVPGRVVIAGGGSDPADVTRQIVEHMRFLKVGILALIGPGNKRDYTDVLPEYSIARNPCNSIDLLSTAQVAIVSFGMTAFECLALGVPVVALSISEEHARSAEMVETQSGGALVHLGRHDELDPEDIAQACEHAMAHEKLLSWKALQYIHGKGGYMVAKKIVHALNCVDEWEDVVKSG